MEVSNGIPYMSRVYWIISTVCYDSNCFLQPVAEVLVYLHVQISPNSCNVVGSILHELGKNTDTAIVGYRWTRVGGHHALYC